MKIINRNFFTLLSCGAFGYEGCIEPMSQFKWEQAILMAEYFDVLPLLAKGIITHKDKCGINLTEKQWSDIRTAAAMAVNDIAMVSPHLKDKYNMPHLANAMNNMRLKRIVYDEYHSIDTSVVSLNLIEIIIKNINSLMTAGMSISGIVQLGLFLRQHGHNIDFVKTEMWIDKLRIKNMSNLIGCMLILFFHFEEAEIPFVHKKDSNTENIINRYVEHAKSKASECLTRHEHPHVMADKYLCSGMRYFGYMPVEAVCRTLSGFARRLSEIEE